MKVLAGTSNLKLCKNIARQLKLKLVNSHIKRFADGEVYIEIDTFSKRDFFYSYRRSCVEIEKDYGRCISVILMT